jgi:cellulose synthase/poly-beta-1,6-N-acetylglucosamine synthase-like glycosyltransferase
VTLIFWLCLLLLGYVYAGYPICVWLLSLVRPWPLRRPEGEYLPTVTVLIAAYNEAEHIELTVRNKLEQDYPPEKLDVIVVSDESDDGTDAIVAGIGDPRVQLVRQEPRAGKTSGLNLIAPRARGEVLVTSDANSFYARDTVRELVQPLADPAVGYVTGRMLYRAPDGSATGEGCSTYMRYENQLRAWETRLGSIVGVDGGVDAIRAAVWEPMRPDQLPDFVEPLTVREKGYRVVYQPTARLYEDALADTGDEFRMRVRVSLRAWWALKDKAALLSLPRFGLFAWQLWSHKVLRYLAPVFQAGVLLSNLVLAGGGGDGWGTLLVLQVLFYGVVGAAHGLRDRDLPGPVTAAYYLCLVNLASGVALVQFLQGKKKVTWTPRT